MDLKVPNKISRSICLLTLIATSVSCGDRNLISMQVNLSRSVSKLPFVIALDQGLYKKYGLDIEVRMEPPEFDGGIWMPSNGIGARIWRRIRSITGRQELWKPEIYVSGGNGRIVRIATGADQVQVVFLAATDCVVRAHIVAAKGIKRLEDLKGKRLGVSSMLGNTGYAALLLAERMGWDPIQDISIMLNGNNMDALREGRVDAFVASDLSYSTALQEGFPVLAATSEWGETMAGNSVYVSPEWLEDPGNREAARRFLQATVEGIALFHQDRDLVLENTRKVAWHHRSGVCRNSIRKWTMDSTQALSLLRRDYEDDGTLRFKRNAEVHVRGFLRRQPDARTGRERVHRQSVQVDTAFGGDRRQ